MKHEAYKEQILLSLLGELAENERRALEGHLGGCADCRAELEETRAYLALIGEAGAAGPSDDVLREARRGLREALAKQAPPAVDAAASRKVPTRERAWSQPGRPRSPNVGRPGWAGWFTPARVALAGTAAVAIGFLAGYVVSGRMAGTVVEGPPADTARLIDAAGGETALGASSYQNVRLAGIDPRSNEVEVVYDMVRPARLKAGVEDERVQRILAQAVTNDDNPGARLQAIHMIGAYVKEPHGDEIKRALIQAAKTDPNAGVRKQALYVLYRMPFDGEIKDACLQVLAGDENEGLRIAAINVLAMAMLDGRFSSEDAMNAVGARFQEDENGYIRIQSGAFLQEVNGRGD